MFKGFVATAIVLASASFAHANDSAFAKIRVKAISPGSLKAGHDVKFYGVNAEQFFEMLPPIASAMTEEEAKQANARYRYLAIVSGKNSINITCTKSKVTECSIALSKPETEGDSFDYVAPVCK